MRKRITKAGMKGWAVAVTGYGLPDGLPHKAPVTAVRQLRGTNVVVRDEGGVEWELPWWLVDCGSEMRDAKGVFRDESDPVLLDFLEARLAEMRDLVKQQDFYVPLIANTAWILRRNGRDPGGDEDLRDRGFQRGRYSDDTWSIHPVTGIPNPEVMEVRRAAYGDR